MIFSIWAQMDCNIVLDWYKSPLFWGPKETSSLVVPPPVHDLIAPSVMVSVFKLRIFASKQPKPLSSFTSFTSNLQPHHGHGFLHQIKQNPLTTPSTFNRLPWACLYHHDACGSLFLSLFNDPLKAFLAFSSTSHSCRKMDSLFSTRLFVLVVVFEMFAVNFGSCIIHATEKYVSAIGDPGMKNSNVRVAFEAWNFCNEVGSEAPNMGSPRLADCADLNCRPLLSGMLFSLGKMNFVNKWMKTHNVEMSFNICRATKYNAALFTLRICMYMHLFP